LINLKENYEKLKFLNKFNTLILQKIKLWGPLVALLILCSLAFWFNRKQVSSESACHLDGASCTFLVQDGLIELSLLSDSIETEALIAFKLDLADGLIFESGWIEGVNMYMGRTPILRKDNETKKTDIVMLETFIGSCSQPTMLWEMTLTFSDAKGREYQRYVNFETVRGT
jgi:hypothetical protein